MVIIKVAVGSTNPVKIEAVKQAFEKVWPDKTWEVVGVGVDSGVSNQPMSDEESITGARTRAKQALIKTGSEFGVGLEGGLENVGGKQFESGWAVVVDKNGAEGIGSSIKMEVSARIYKMIKEGKELGEVIDIIFSRENLKQQEGYFGTMTNKIITRAQGYSDGVISALARFLHPEIY